MITARGLCKRYGNVTALNGVEFSARPGEITALLGPNSSGKSTLLRLLSGVSFPDQGEVLIDDARLRDLPSLRGVLGFCLDGVAIHPSWRVQDQLHIVAPLVGVAAERVEDVIEKCGLSSIRRCRGRELSLGMRQRVGIALSLLSNPPCLILDEPANGLDPVSTRWLRRLLTEHATSGGVVIFSSHLMSEVEHLADRIIVLLGGEIIWDSPTKELIDSLSTTQVIIEGPNVQDLRVALTDRGAQVATVEGGLSVIGLSREDVGFLAYEHGTVVTGLRSEHQPFEELYLDLLTNKESVQLETMNGNAKVTEDIGKEKRHENP